MSKKIIFIYFLRFFEIIENLRETFYNTPNSGNSDGDNKLLKDLARRLSELEKGLKNFISKANIDFIIRELERLEKEKANLFDFNLLKSAHGKI